MMNEQLIAEIVDFWKKETGRPAPKRISLERFMPYQGLFLIPEEIKIHPSWADDAVVFHELAHLEQWQDGRLTINCHDPEVYSFEGKRVDEFPYQEQPAEIEAWKISKERVERFRATRNLVI